MRYLVILTMLLPILNVNAQKDNCFYKCSFLDLTWEVYGIPDTVPLTDLDGTYMHDTVYFTFKSFPDTFYLKPRLRKYFQNSGDLVIFSCNGKEAVTSEKCSIMFYLENHHYPGYPQCDLINVGTRPTANDKLWLDKLKSGEAAEISKIVFTDRISMNQIELPGIFIQIGKE